eukprot:NODE_5580_length_637_cov_22.194118_g5416_i0.p1 GENE.NODE_5580_length_637_cov_22.194118_g5416_i0~~NODE_5580_length_637_cov_22.194118_g5416_i0.p1  ORF type:complete len:143 (+),score=36.44 NODE_5580_length_637_cov_22.194118_g5416_i0:32-430(+)
MSTKQVSLLKNDSCAPNMSVHYESPLPWDTQLTECNSDAQSCFCAFFLTPCQMAQQKAVLRGKSDLCCDMLIYTLLPCLQVRLRSSIRSKYNIDGTVCTDAVQSCFCCPCAVAQQGRQLKLRGEKMAACVMC